MLSGFCLRMLLWTALLNSCFSVKAYQQRWFLDNARNSRRVSRNAKHQNDNSRNGEADESREFDGVYEQTSPSSSTRPPAEGSTEDILCDVKKVLLTLLKKLGELEQRQKERNEVSLMSVTYSSNRDLKKRKRNENNSLNSRRPRWGEWTGWSACSVTCGKGREIRWRHCIEDCDSAETEMEEKACQLPACGPGKIFGIQL